MDAPPAVLEDKAATQQFLLQLTARLVVDTDADRDRGPHVRSAIARLLSMYALWFAATADAPVEAALRYLFRVMAVPEVRNTLVNRTEHMIASLQLASYTVIDQR